MGSYRIYFYFYDFKDMFNTMIMHGDLMCKGNGISNRKFTAKHLLSAVQEVSSERNSTYVYKNTLNGHTQSTRHNSPGQSKGRSTCEVSCDSKWPPLPMWRQSLIRRHVWWRQPWHGQRHAAYGEIRKQLLVYFNKRYWHHHYRSRTLHQLFCMWSIQVTTGNWIYIGMDNR